MRKRAKPYRGLGMEGPIARWYARNADRGIVEYQRAAMRILGALPLGAEVLDLATGPGHLAIELAKLRKRLGPVGPSRVSALDVSRTLLGLAADNARKADVDVEFRLGDASALPFGDQSFDAVVCRSSFKNFAAPVRALDEMERVLRPGGFGLIMDLNGETPDADIDDYVDQMPMGGLSRSLTRFIFKRMLLKRAYRPSDFANMAAASRFGACETRPAGIGLDVWLHKPGADRVMAPAGAGEATVRLSA